MMIPASSELSKLEHTPSAVRNRSAIFEVLSPRLRSGEQVLEIGSGTAEHAIYFCKQRSDISWQPSEHPAMFSRLGRVLSAIGSPANLAQPLSIDVSNRPWPQSVHASVIYSANTLHMMPMTSVRDLFEESARVLDLGNASKTSHAPCLCIYGPMSIDGIHVSDGNRVFDQQLRNGNPALGIRDLSELNQIAEGLGFDSAEVISMPANNRLAIWS